MAELPARIARDSKPFKRFVLITKKPYIATPSQFEEEG